MTFRGCFPLFSKTRQIFSGSYLLMSKTKFDETYIFKISLKIRFFSYNNWYQISFFRVLFTIEPGRSLLQFDTELFDTEFHIFIDRSLKLLQ